MGARQLLVIDGRGAIDIVNEMPNAEVFKDLDHLISTLPESTLGDGSAKTPAQ